MNRRLVELTRRDVLAVGVGGLLLPEVVRGAPTNTSINRTAHFRQESTDGYVQAVTTTHSLATDAGATILQSGGSAADAAVAIAAMLSVVEPYFSHAMGGGTWALYYDAESGTVTSLDGVGPVGSGYDADDFAARVGQRGIHQAIVPGAWDGWMLWLREFGRLSLPELLAPAVSAAEEGIVISAEMGSYGSSQLDWIVSHPSTAATYVQNGASLGEGDVIFQPNLAETFRAVGEAYAGSEDHVSGIQAARDYFYRGPIAEAMVAESDANGGYLTLADFAEFAAELVEPVSISYGSNTRVYQNPPNSQGIAMLIALNILKNFDHTGLSIFDPYTVHTQIEATKLAYADRNAFIGDPDFVDIDLELLLSDDHAANQADRIDLDRAMQWPENAPVTQMEPQNTTTFHVSDKWGNAAAVTTSLGLNFHVIGETGIHINNRMQYTSPDPSSPNFAEAGRKLRHTSCPYIVMRNDVPLLVGGNTGADSQPQVQLQQVMAAIDFGMTAQEAIDHPRWIARSWVPSTYPHEVANDVQVESTYPQSLVTEMANRGHNVFTGSRNLGNGGMIQLSENRSSATVGAEPRFSTASASVLD